MFVMEVTILTMLVVTSRILFALVMTGVVTSSLFAQTVPAAPPPKPRIEPGLEMAVQWKWWVVPSDEKNWGFALPETPQSPGTPGAPTVSISAVAARPDSYEVKRGDALVIIARKFGMEVDQLKAFNNLTKDTIQIGQVLKIPTLKELYAMAPPPEPAAESAEKNKPAAAPKAPMTFTVSRETENVMLQVFLDREHFSTGPIDGNPGVVFEKALELYRSAHEDVPTAEMLRQKAVSVVSIPFTRYALKADDFRFISAEVAPAPSPARKSSKSKQAPELPPQTYEELIAAALLAYRTPWEFVAERFHCDETFLRSLNVKIKGIPVVGTEFQVPNVIPFEIEKAFDAPLQPTADAGKPVTAAIVELNRLEIYQSGKLVAAMPMSLARPDLRGRSTWTVLDVIPRPRLATRQEQKTTAKTTTVSAFTTPLVTEATPPPAPASALAAEQYLAAGPNNPLGILWINLAKAKSTEPLPYGLHGTSIPGRMKTQESLGGMRLANWDIVRAVRMLPAGTPLQWK